MHLKTLIGAGYRPVIPVAWKQSQMNKIYNNADFPPVNITTIWEILWAFAPKMIWTFNDS